MTLTADSSTAARLMPARQHRAARLPACMVADLHRGLFLPSKEEVVAISDCLGDTIRPQFLDSNVRVSIEAVQNETVRLSCEALGDPRPQFTWYRRDVVILQPSMDVPSLPSGSAASGSDVVSLGYQEVGGLPVANLFDRSAMQPGDLDLEAYRSVSGGNAGAVNSASIGANRMRLTMNMAALRGGQVLQLANVQPSDVDEYTCTANNGGGPIEKRFNLTVIGEFHAHTREKWLDLVFAI
ncbi:unnamed protein product [Protopolystoma xenopodis]|uniref:Ig-like domain-containing protein n=1 Tax=Protopolystoma xenopodis TaxID=117903 RepID=A0A448X3H5_9PLAT|nr:unnamed protein product [Protopolystoma xenopodis]